MSRQHAEMRVVVVDDTDHVRTMLVDMLELDGFDVVGQASTAEQGVTETLDKRPDVVVMDYKMPRTNGLVAARQIRDVRPEQPIILYTAYLNPRLEVDARQVGIAVCVGKVEGLTQLERHISELCRDFMRR